MSDIVLPDYVLQQLRYVSICDVVEELSVHKLEVGW